MVRAISSQAKNYFLEGATTMTEVSTLQAIGNGNGEYLTLKKKVMR